ncbi:hypothetical protein ACTA71_009767 [Dictyostelium dimigraforme]
MTTIDILFKKVFNNKILFNLIYEYVHCKENVLDWSIQSLLERNEFGKFEELLDCNIYSSITQENWFYELQPDENDILALLRYKHLKTSSLKEFYWKYKSIFMKERIKDKIISESIKGGNLEIVMFLIDQGFKYRYLHFKNNIRRFYGGVFEEVLECGNNVDCFNFILTNLPNFIPMLLTDGFNWLIDYLPRKGYSNIYPIIIPKIYSKHKLEKAIEISFQYLDKQLVNEIIILNNRLNLVPKASIIEFVSKNSRFIMNDNYFEIFSIYLSKTNDSNNQYNYNINLFEKVKNSLKSKDKIIYSLKVWEINDNNHLLSLLLDRYMPNTHREFKFILDSKLNFFSRQNLYLFAQHLSTEILDLEYCKHFIHLYSDRIKKSCVNRDYSMCVVILCDSIPEISTYFLKEKLDTRILSSAQSFCYYDSNSYFGNLEILKLAEKTYLLRPSLYTLRSAVINGYTDIVEYLCETLPINPIFLLNMLISCEKYNQFQIFKIIINSKYFNSSFNGISELKSDLTERLLLKRLNWKPNFLNYLFQMEILTTPKLIEKFCENDLNSFLFYKSNFKQDIINGNFFFQLIKHSNIQVFNNIITDESFLSKFLITDKLKDKFIFTLISSGSKRLLYFILNSTFLKYIGFNIIFKYLIIFSKSTTINQLLSITKFLNINLIDFYNSLLLYLILFYDKKPHLIEDIKFPNDSLSSNDSNNNYFQHFKDFLKQSLSVKNQTKLKDNYLKMFASYSNILNQIGFIFDHLN